MDRQHVPLPQEHMSPVSRENSVQKIISWLQKNERHISAPLFVAGFIGDVLTLRKLPITSGVYIYGLCLIGVAVTSILAHYLHEHDERGNKIARTVRILALLAAQFITGSLLSGSLIYYTKGAALVASWPFITLLAIVFVGNEVLGIYRERLAFRSILFFFTVYAYTIFALPVFTHTINQETFLKSTACSVGVFAFFLVALALAGFERLQASFLEMAAGVIVIALLVMGAYFTSVIPPLPLSLTSVGVYESVIHSGDTYILKGEGQTQPWWDVFGTRPITVEYIPGSSLSVFSSVFAPVSFSTGVVHVWDWFDTSTHTWKQRAEIAFVINGGRDGGYRGYSTLSNLVPGQYRVSVETLSGQVIGRIYFQVVDVQTLPPLVTTTNS